VQGFRRAYPKNTFEYYNKYDHQKLRFGDADPAFARADIVLDEHYQMSPIEHAPTETNGSIAVPDIQCVAHGVD
jgi:CO/xanthine dehydrogenase Mo-binding subunit